MSEEELPVRLAPHFPQSFYVCGEGKLTHFDLTYRSLMSLSYSPVIHVFDDSPLAEGEQRADRGVIGVLGKSNKEWHCLYLFGVEGDQALDEIKLAAGIGHRLSLKTTLPDGDKTIDDDPVGYWRDTVTEEDGSITLVFSLTSQFIAIPE
jgi:hypothetical protein